MSISLRKDRFSGNGDFLEENDGKIRAGLQSDYLSPRLEIETKIAELSQSGTEAWEDIKSGLDLAGEAMSTALKSATARFFQ